MIWVPQLSPTSMQRIFSSILGGFLALNEDAGLSFLSDQLIHASVDLYK